MARALILEPFVAAKRRMLEWKELHRVELLQAWALARTSRPLPRIDPLE
jgi:hypothetical protein